MKYQDYGIIAKAWSKSITGYMYILPTCVNMEQKDMIENQHWVKDPRIVRINLHSFFYNIFFAYKKYFISFTKTSI